MKAIHINPITQTIREIEIPNNGDELNPAIYAILECQLFDVVRLEDGDGIFVDDEGLLKDEPGPFFTLWGYPNPIAGHGLVLGCDEDGNSCAPVVTVQEIRDRVVWLPTIQAAAAYANRFEPA
jgi:hypothetical protein